MVPVVWIHAVSVGETRAAQPLIEALMAALQAAAAEGDDDAVQQARPRRGRDVAQREPKPAPWGGRVDRANVKVGVHRRV